MRISTGVSFAVVMAMSVVSADTVAWWPLAYENGVRTTVDTVLVNKANPGTLDAKPISMTGATIIEGSAYCPQGTSGFPAGWGVWEPQSGTAEENATSLYFHKVSVGGNAGALRVSDPEGKLKLQTFTFEAFIRMQQGTSKSDWNCVAVMPGKLYTSTGAKVLNYDGWALRVTGQTQMQARFTKPGAMSTDVTNVSSYNQALAFTTPNVYDGNWHHVAIVVTASEGKAHAYFDYEYKNSLTLDGGLSYGVEDLYIGSTPQTDGCFGGSIANVRISDKVLATAEFLQLTDVGNTGADVVLDADFETPEGMFDSESVLINKGRGSYVSLTTAGSTTKYPHRSTGDMPTDTTYSSLVASNGVSNAKALENTTITGWHNYAAYTPVGDEFTNSSFTVECFYKTTQSAQYIPLVRRRGGSNVQFNLGFGGTAGRLSATVLAKGNNSKACNDTVETNDGKWHHGALVVDALTKTLSLYRDYKFVGSATFANEKTLVAGTHPVCVAGVDNGNMFNGQVDDVRITMRALKPGEFKQGNHFDVAARTLAWAGFEDTLVAEGGALKDGVATVAKDGGEVPAFVVQDRGTPKVMDGRDVVLKNDNVKALAFKGGVVKYSDNPLLPLFRDQTVEFFVKAGPQDGYSGIVRCNVSRTEGTTPAWALSFDGQAKATELRVRYVVRYSTGQTGDNSFNTGVIIGDNRWHHIAMTIHEFVDATGITMTTVAIYKDKSLVPDWTKTTSGSIYYGDGCGSVWLGASSSTTAFFNGCIDELRISQGVLDPLDFLRFGKLGLTIILH